MLLEVKVPSVSLSGNKHYFKVTLEKPSKKRASNEAQKNGSNPLTVDLMKSFNHFH
jgi:hypothetical protein